MIMNELKGKSHIWEILMAFLFFLLMKPGFMWGFDPTFIRTLLIFVLLLKLDVYENKHLYLLFFFFVTLSIYPISHHNSIFGFIYFTTLALIPFSKKQFILSSFRFYKRLLACITFISLVIWLLVVVLGIDLPYSIINPLNELKTYNYRSYIFLLVPMNIVDYDILRFNCMFDEPGVVGTYSLIMLISDNFNWGKRENWVFLISGIVSFSFFFYLGLIVFTLINIYTLNVKLKYKISAVFLSLFFLVAIQMVPVLNEMVGYRLEYDSSTGKFVGDNRSNEELDDHIASIRGTYGYFWGERDEVVEYYLECAGLNTAIIRFGVVFIFLYVFFFVFYSYYKSGKDRKEVFIFMIAILATIYQRPGLINAPFIFMFVGIVINRSNIINRLEKQNC